MSSIFLNTIMSICFVAGKSGGHLLPCITNAHQIQEAKPSTEIYLFSTGSELDKKIMAKHSNIHHYIPCNLWDVPYGKPLLYLPFLCNATWYFCKSLYGLWKFKPQKVISFGGFNSIPVCLAAKILQIPIEIYELNVEPGKATKFLSRLTDTIYVCFEQTKSYFPNKHCILFQYPVRFHEKDTTVDKQIILKKYNLDENKKTILILGGSQGSTLLNEVMKKTIQTYPALRSNIQIIHQTGSSDPFDYASFYHEHGIPAVVFSYHEQLQDFYLLADLIICRAGAGTLFEIKFFNKKCICIPHQTLHTNHQYKNAVSLAHQNPKEFVIIKQDDFTAQKLNELLYDFLSFKLL